MADNLTEIMAGQLVALDLLLRGLYTKWALEAPDPIASNRRKLEGMIASMWSVKPPNDETERRLYAQAESHLRHFLQQVETRLIGEGARS